ncbi:prolyl oligopeptidase family serine peptidase [Sphingomonas sp. BT-65]|uniref:prolyl oligopeptidase family serine peptidase n=1 Tax=Sphingomonas sp. BT-65 TaxID=2989821 RepID=UPI002235C4D1|nr:prolyl oligopeptidase family serine peptidase [Sphingomonas sp. BT-65]MCW4463524.1 prolyl oligopeptidase family serine peptidase [Sphingomonas sp. BT-65]
MTRSFIAAALLLSATAMPASLCAQQVHAPKVPFAENVFGDAVSDPYRWMEDPARRGEMLAWLEASSSAARRQLEALPERPAFAALLAAATAAGTSQGEAQSAGNRLFFLRAEPSDQTAKLIVREGRDERVLFAPPKGAAISNYSVAPDGLTVAVHVARGGGEAGDATFIDVASGMPRGTALGPIWGQLPVSWLSNERVAYTRMAGYSGEDLQRGMQVVVMQPGAADGGRAVFGHNVSGNVSASEFPSIGRGIASDLVVAMAGGARADVRALVTPASALEAPSVQWHEAVGYDAQALSVAVRGRDIFYVSTLGASNGALMRRRFGANGVEAAERVLAPGDLILSDVYATRDGIYVVGRRDGIVHLLFLAGGNAPAREVPLSREADIRSATTSTDGAALLFGLTDWTHATDFHRAIGGKVSPLGLESATWTAARDIKVIREEAVSRDGQRVPMIILAPRRRSGTVPTILGGYGAYGQATTSPWYQSYFLPWAAHGGALALCGTRGGGERGRDWHEAGRSANRPMAHADFIACAERLVEAGYARRGTIAATGTSAGGTLVPPAVLMRPELFSALLPRVAILNPTRLAVADNGPNQFAEMGDPATPAGYAALVAQDSYRMLETARDLPDTLLTLGLNDRRVSPWMSAKFAARALERFGDRRRVLIRADAEAGHGVGSARDRLIAEFTDLYAFAWDRASAGGNPGR